MIKENITLRALRQYKSYHKRYFPLKFSHIILKNLVPYFNLWMSSEVITALTLQKPKEDIYLLVSITLLGNLCFHLLDAVLGRSVEHALKMLQNGEAAAFHRKTLTLDYDKLENPDIRTLRRTIRENTRINGYGTASLRQNIEILCSSICSLILAAVFFFEMMSRIIRTGFSLLPLLLLVGMLLSMTASILNNRHSQSTLSGLYEKISALMLKENQLGLGHHPDGMDARIYRQQEIITDLENRMNRDHQKLQQDAKKREFLLYIPFAILSSLPEFFAYLIVCFYCVMGIFPIGSVIKYVGYLNRVTVNILNLFYCANRLKYNEPFLATYLQYFDIPNDMYQGSLAVEKRSDKKFDIEFRNVGFCYPGTDIRALQGISLKLKAGERLAVVGENGSGKTTFIKLLCRLYDPTEGEIILNDFNVRKYDYRQYLDIFSVVFQDYKLLSLPLGNNIAAAGTWNTERAEMLLQEAGFGCRYAELPEKLDTPLYRDFDENGVNISGGEAQKIALARALYRDTAFIILDEPTAALDPVAEAEIYSRFDEIVGDKTAIYISHRLASCRFCDRIVVFDHGRIVQVGTHEELLSDTHGKYSELWNAQAQYYKG